MSSWGFIRFISEQGSCLCLSVTMWLGWPRCWASFLEVLIHQLISSGQEIVIPLQFFFFYSVDMVIHASTVRSDPSGLTSPCSSTCSGGSSPHVLPHKPPSPILTLPALQNPLTRQTHVPGSPFSVGSPSRTTRAAIQTCLGESTELRTKRFL